VAMDLPVMGKDESERPELITNTRDLGDPCLNDRSVIAFREERDEIRDLKLDSHHRSRKVGSERDPRTPCGLVSYPSQAVSPANCESARRATVEHNKHTPHEEHSHCSHLVLIGV
jgi:hypothetical protein